MAQQTTVRFVDDIDGSEAVGTVSFSLNNRSYEIDLSDENTDKLHDALAPFVEHARQIAGRGSGRGRGQRQPATDKPARSSREDTQAIRVWAREHGHEVSDRGPHAAHVVDEHARVVVDGDGDAANRERPITLAVARELGHSDRVSNRRRSD